MWNIWVQNGAVKNMQESSEIDHEEGEILISAHTAKPGKVCCLWSGKWIDGCNEAEAFRVWCAHIWRLAQSQQYWKLLYN